jgi:tripartite-type tricarboxylate transporter receptor subunit TctC
LKRIVLAAVAAIVAGAAQAQDYPNKAVRVIVPYPPGGGTDTASRMIGENLAKQLGQQVIIENKAGGNTIIGTEEVAKSAPDGYTLLVQTISFSVNPALYKDLPYDSSKDFTPISLLVINPLVLAVNPSVPSRNLGDFIQYLKDNPQTPYSSSGNGGAMHLAAEVFLDQAGVKALHVPYKGESPAITDLLGNKVKFAFASVAASSAHFQAGTLVPLVTLQEKRLPKMPDVPTAMEAGLPNYTAYTWFALLAPAGLPVDITEKLSKAVNAAVLETKNSPETQGRLDQLGFQLVTDSTPESTAKWITDETAKWKEVVDKVGITAE